ncbi:hypothetical protein FNV43_RR22330 [Rhamnella rubrinervis]|uniref:ATP-dependent Clp protease ATP-binding subunit n=1 Tax=Rhamnella rubrinervis TaxID=2594499 RepID=A0A8K0DVZ8_9ROSA|nr:hypothetical protein FNV43_RR22330 [Rhamnella rubrinervis]
MEKLEQNNLKIETLLKYGTDFTKMAEEGKLDPVIGRQLQIERVMQILNKRKKNNPCLIGDPGVGKTVIVEGLAQRIVNANVPLKLLKKKVFSLDMGRLIAGASNRGEFEERLIMIVDEVEKNEGQIILFIDEVHTLIGAGAGGQALDAANILKPALARGVLKCIGATTLDEYRKYIEKDSALKRRLTQVEVPEPTVDETVEILKGLCTRYEKHHNVKYAEEALVAAARLSRLRFLPDKAIDLIDEAGSRLQLKRTQVPPTIQVVTESHTQYLISSWTGIPVENVSKSEALKLLSMENILHKRIIGQNKAVESISRAIRRARSGIRDPAKPIASFLFTGPTGVGKTEMANTLAIEYFGSKDSIIRLDMSEYMEGHTASKMFGSPPGYIGHDEGGQLTESIRQMPHSLILFDEIEKAHRDVFNVLLQVLDYGRLTDSKGQKVDFTNTVIILTSNIGGTVIGSAADDIGDQVELKVAEELKRNFRPEFLNRIDEVVLFHQLSINQLNELADIMLKEISDRLLTTKKILLKVTKEFKEKLVKEGNNSNYGARPLKRAIVRNLEDFLAENLLKGDIKEGDLVTLGLEGKEK